MSPGLLLLSTIWLHLMSSWLRLLHSLEPVSGRWLNPWQCWLHVVWEMPNSGRRLEGWTASSYHGMLGDLENRLSTALNIQEQTCRYSWKTYWGLRKQYLTHVDQL